MQESPITILDRRRLLMILGTTEVEGEIRTGPEKGIAPGRTGLAFFKPFDLVMAFVGDRYIVRMPTPPVTIGGGMILDLISQMPRRKDMPRLAYLDKRADFSLPNLVQSELDKKLFVSPVDFRYCNFSDMQIGAYLNESLQSGGLQTINGRFFRAADVQAGEKRILEIVADIFARRPHLDGIKPEMIIDKSGQTAETITPIMELLLSNKKLIKKGNRLDLPGREISVEGELKRLADQLEKHLLDGEYAPPTLKELTGGDADRQEALDYLMAAGIAVRINPELAFHKSIWNKALDVIKEMLKSEGTLTVSTLRDKLGCSRKYLIPILEYTDTLGLTRREGDVRVPGDNFEKE
jgi:selenocysteine-specific elongation factor